jgi:hypothetical protein
MNEQEISRFVEDANNGFEQKGPYALHCLAACVVLILMVEQFHTRFRTQSNTLLLFLAIVIAQGLARALSVQVLCSLFPPWLCELGSAVADATDIYLSIKWSVLIQTVCCFLWFLCYFLWYKGATISWGAVGRRVLRCGCDVCSSLDSPPTYSMWREMSVLVLLVFLACVFYENVFHLLCEIAIRVRFLWLLVRWVVVPLLTSCTHANTKWCGENLKKWMTDNTPVFADILSAMAAQSTTPASTAPPARTAPGASPAPTGPLDGAELLKKTTKELQAMLLAKGLSKYAPNKSILVNRLLAAPP